ncbi:hypothetical protein Tco_1418176 [Tanacetum coccineum]
MFDSFADLALPPRDQRHEWLRLHEIKDGDQDTTERSRMQHMNDNGEVLFTTSVWRELLGISGPLVREIILEFFNTLRISSGGDFLGSAPSYTLIREPLRMLCHRLIAFTISSRGQAPKKVTTTDLFCDTP